MQFGLMLRVQFPDGDDLSARLADQLHTLAEDVFPKVRRG